MGDVMFGSGMFEIIFFAIFVLVIGTFVVSIVQGIGQWNKNNHSPRLDVLATVVTKRMDVEYFHDDANADGMHTVHTSTSYYVTFQVESGDRIELEVDGYDYGQLVEGDFGKLSFQGTRFQGFERKEKEEQKID